MSGLSSIAFFFLILAVAFAQATVTEDLLVASATVSSDGKTEEEPPLLRSAGDHEPKTIQDMELKPHVLVEKKEQKQVRARQAGSAVQWADGESPAREELKHAIYFVLFLVLTVFGAGLVYYLLVQRKALQSSAAGLSSDSRSGSSVSEQSSSRLKSLLQKYDDNSSIADSDSASEDSSEKIAYLFNRVRTSLENLNQKSQQEQQGRGSQ